MDRHICDERSRSCYFSLNCNDMLHIMNRCGLYIFTLKLSLLHTNVVHKIDDANKCFKGEDQAHSVLLLVIAEFYYSLPIDLFKALLCCIFHIVISMEYTLFK